MIDDQKARDRYLQRAYGISCEEYDAMLAAQDGRCAICGKKPGRTRLAVDHDHKTGRVRGLLHPRCNRSLAPFESDVAAMRRLIAYLERAIAIRLGSTAP